MAALTKTALTTSFADNATGAIVASSHRNLVDSVLGCYAQLRGAAQTQVGVTPTPTPVLAFTEATIADNVTANVGAGSLTITVAGVYEVIATVSPESSSGPESTYDFAVDGVATGFAQHDQGAGHDKHHVSLAQILELAAAEVLTVVVSVASGSANFTWHSAVFFARRIG